MGYNAIFESAITNVLSDYSDNKIRFFSERDLQAHLFYACRKLMEEQNFPCPLKLYAEKSVFSRRAKVDLVLGDDAVLVELKLEPDYPGVNKPVVFTTKKEASGSGSIEGDLEKIGEYSRKGKCAHLIVIDEDGRHTQKIANEKWKTVQINLGGPNKLVHYIHVKHGPCDKHF